MNLLDLFLRKTVIVDVEGYRLKGQFIVYTDNMKTNHVPAMLLLKTKSERLVLVRGSFTTIGEPT